MIAREPTPLERRVAITQATLDAWKDRPFDWNGSHCIRLAADHLRAMGYRPPLSRGGSFKTALAARAALRRAGVATLVEAVDLMKLPRIAPAAALPGDLVAMPGEAPFEALAVAVGNGRVLGFHQDAEGAIVQQPREYVAAWRVEPREAQR